MTDHSKRVSQENLAELLESAVKLENERIEHLNAELVDQVTGGVTVAPPGIGGIVIPGTDAGGATMGMFPTPDQPDFN